MFQGVFPASLEEVKQWLFPGYGGHKSDMVGLASPYSNEQIHSRMRLMVVEELNEKHAPKGEVGRVPSSFCGAHFVLRSEGWVCYETLELAALT